jgi:hypothetical protein
MKCISLWQPWASAVALGSKRVETRHWATDYRGPIAIHAAKRKRIHELLHYRACWNWQGALWEVPGWRWSSAPDPDYFDALPFGAIVAVGVLTDCRPTDSFTQAELDAPRRPEGETSDSYDWTERQMGNFELGRFGWVLENVRPLDQQIPYSGLQSLFSVPDELILGACPAVIDPAGGSGAFALAAHMGGPR